jgi:hypothetical protein
MSKVACIGAGYWGQNLVRNFHRLGALDTICDVSEAALAAFREPYPGVRLTGSVSGVLSRPDFALVVGNPARVTGHMCRCATKLSFARGRAACPGCGEKYFRRSDSVGLLAEAA